MRDKHHEQDYINKKCIDCPYCSQNSPVHSCRNCYSTITKKTCWNSDGYCSACYKHIYDELPKIREEKKKLGIKCQCDDPNCTKCLSINCQDDNCPTHTLKLKNKHKDKTHAKS
jgi:hypothetical protein